MRLPCRSAQLHRVQPGGQERNGLLPEIERTLAAASDATRAGVAPVPFAATATSTAVAAAAVPAAAVARAVCAAAVAAAVAAAAAAAAGSAFTGGFGRPRL